MRISFSDYFISFRQLISGKRVRDERALAVERARDLLPDIDLNRPQRVLDLANGRLRPQYELLRAVGHHVVGIDLINRPQPIGPDEIAYRLARWLYRSRLPEVSGHANHLICGDVGVLPFPDDYFDVVTSIAAFEHFLNVPAVVAEVQRVLRPGGLAYIRVHPFACPSGGHNVRLMEIPLRHLPLGVDAWDHLRQRRLLFTVPLNEWRIEQYVTEFAHRFEIIRNYCAMREGEAFLTPAIEHELSAFTPDELTCGAYVIVTRKR
jgi:ubiquinone/menaquinone biosynthesis C-methylase UbiE